MSALQRFAWFNLAVIGLTIVVVVSLYPFGGKGAMGGFGFLGLFGFWPLFFRKKPGQVVADERDQLIWQRAWVVAYSVFWVVFCLGATFLCVVVYGEDGAVPVWLVASSIWLGLMLVFAVASLAILVQYGRGSKDGE